MAARVGALMLARTSVRSISPRTGISRVNFPAADTSDADRASCEVRAHLYVVHAIQQSHLVTGGLDLPGNALILCKQRGIALHIRRWVGQLRDLQQLAQVSGKLE